MSGVEDLVGNVLQRPVVWQFEVEKSESLSSKSTLEGVVLNTPYLLAGRSDVVDRRFELLRRENDRRNERILTALAAMRTRSATAHD